MRQTRFKFVSIAALSILTCTTVQALPFNSFDPRSMAMGGAGVSVTDPGTAPLFNPALLTATDPSKKYSVELPVIGVRLYDPGNLRNELTTLSDNVNALNSSITTVNTNSATGATTAQLALVPTNMNTVASNIDKVNTSLQTLNNQPLQGEFGAATVVGVPGKNWGVGFYLNAYGAVGGTLLYKDSTTLSNLSTDVKSAAKVLAGTTAVVNNAAAQTACTAVAAGTGTSAQVTTCLNYASGLSNLSSSLNAAQNAVNFNTNTQIASQIHLRGVAISEAGLSLSHGFITHDQAWSLGVTPKIMQLQLFDAYLAANNGNSTSNVTGNDYLEKYSTMNMDLGVARNYENGWHSGIVVKNLIPQTFDFKSIGANGTAGSAKSVTGTLSLNPQFRAGVSHENTWSTIALDVDLTQNDPAGLENKSQYIALGGEISAWGWAALRAGYRANVLDSARDVASIGLGISPRIPYFKPHFDLAAAGNTNEIGASLRFGLNF
jgi:hypothetical protein